MSIFGFLRKSPPKSSASNAKERLQILLAHERRHEGLDFLPNLQRDLVAVICRYVAIDRNAVEVKMEKADDLSTIEVNIELPLDSDSIRPVQRIGA